MGAPRSTAPGLTLDTGALIAIDRGDRRMTALLQAAAERGLPLRVPAGAIGQAWRDVQRQARLARFLRVREVDVQVLDEHVARAAGTLCGVAGTTDLIDATVVIAARPTRDVILTSDHDDIHRLDPSLPIERI